MNQITGERSKKNRIKKKGGLTSNKRKTDKLQQRVKQLFSYSEKKICTETIQESNKINIISHSRYVVKLRSSTGEVK